MELNCEIPSAPPRDAATVLLLRDTPSAMEVFLVKRHGASDVLGGAYVFPGGKLDVQDCELYAPDHLDQTPSHLHRALGEPEISTKVAAGLYVAALRETFEESRVLFARDTSTARAALKHDPKTPFNQLLRNLAVRLQTRHIHPWARWITPRMPSVTNKRFDTRFFVAPMPAAQLAQHDNFETTDSVWLQPRAALIQYWDGLIELAPPQIMSLAHLSRHATVQSVMNGARNSLPPLIFPETFHEGSARIICYPGDARHSIAKRAMPGPTRMVYRNGRFEPEHGFEAFFT
jgi:8-oxo-dGTP pyrophosphatase MutT (NUDIX family)